MTNNSENLRFNRPPLFSPSLVRGLREDAAKSSVFEKVIGADLIDSSMGVSESFKYDLDEQGVRSTQQLKIDWSSFENHTFFNSAQVKTNVAFDTIINTFPFDGNQQELEVFTDRLTGFEKYVFDEYPKYKGYAFFSGSNGSETDAGTWITVKDMAGAVYPDLSRDNSGVSKLNPGFSSTTTEMWLYLPSGINTGQTVINKLTQSSDGLDGFAFVVKADASVTYATASYCVTSKSLGQNVSFVLTKGAWNNISLIWDRNPNVNKLLAYTNQALVASSSAFELGETFWNGIPLTIGSGSSISFGSYIHTEQNTLSGAIDDLRLWHTNRTPEQRVESQKKAIFSSSDLKLYFKFNEPSGSNTLVVLDNSGNSLHGKLNIAGNALRVREIATGTVAGADPMTLERLDFCPILFPNHPAVDVFRNTLLVSASYFDDENPNLITKLIPKHYLLEGQVESGISSETGEITTTLISGSDPKSAQLGGTQLLLSLSYVWAKYFDEIKLFTQAFSNLNWTDYDDTDVVPDQFLQFLAKQQGFELPPLFTGSSISQYINKENIQDEVSTNSLSLQYIQNQIWRRILINLQDVVRSKGTIHSVKSFIRSVGIDPDNNFRIREFGGPNKAPLNFSRDKRSEISAMADFVSGGYVQSSYLSSSRTEPGLPLIGSATAAWNGMFTSGSWTYEGTYKFQSNIPHESQSLARFMTTGSLIVSGVLIGNLMAVSGTTNINFYAQTNTALSPVLSMVLTGANIFDGNKWYVSVGRQRHDHVDLSSTISSSYFIRAARANYGDIVESYFTQSFFNDRSGSSSNNIILQKLDSVTNASGVFITIGSASIDQNIIIPTFLNVSGVDSARATQFDGKVGQIRFWSKYLGDSEWPEHVRNFKSLGVQDPTTNFNFNTTNSGSWERLRVDVSTDQITTGSDSGGLIQLFDFSQNLQHWSGSAFLTSSQIIKPERFFYSYISPKFDEGSTDEKVRPRSFLNYQNVLSSSYAQVAPLYRVELSEEPTDNTRFTINFSIVDALDQDIMGIFSTLDSLDNVIGNPELMFSPDYPTLAFLREIYFNRLTDKINLKSFFEFYKWFDTNIGTFISQLIPRKTKYLGTNFVIESSALERARIEYLYSDAYLGDSNRHGLKDTLLLQLISGIVTR